MAFKTLTILEKNIGDPLESVLSRSRTATPIYSIGTGDCSCSGVSPFQKYEIYTDLEPDDGSFYGYVRDCSVENTIFKETRLYQPYLDEDGNAYQIYDLFSDGSAYDLWNGTYKAASRFSRYICPSINLSITEFSASSIDDIDEYFAYFTVNSSPTSSYLGFRVVQGASEKVFQITDTDIIIDGSAGYTGTVVAGQTMTFINGLLVSVT
jgi:hypothetical protein